MFWNQKIFIIVISSVLFLMTNGTASEQVKPHDTIESLRQKVNFLLSEQRFVEAQRNTQLWLSLLEQKFGLDSKENFPVLIIMGNIHSLLNDAENAYDYYLKSFTVAKKHFGMESAEMESARLNFTFYLPLSSKGSEVPASFSRRYIEIFGNETKGPRVRKLGKLKWPDAAKKTLRGGSIVVKVWVDLSGSVTAAKAMFGDKMFAENAEQSMMATKYYPATREGQPVASIAYARVKFGLR